MSNEVFANGMEVACQAADGKSVACFPDPCWSPPGPPAGPIVIPYPNTAYAKDLANASTTVFISGKPVAQKNKSCFKTSTGNEPATRAFPMGVITGTIQGKAYFASWSMDVKVEGLNVCRHLDLMTHNHGSVPGNTAAWVYVDQADVGRCEKGSGSHACCKDFRDVERACKPSKKEDERFKDARRDINRRRQKKGKPALEDKCLKARKCVLTSKNKRKEPAIDADAESSGKQTLGDLLGMDDSRGCCPGQTGHHLILDAWLQSGGQRGAGDLCNGSYDEGSAPTVCVEGATQNVGTHGTIHRNTTDIAKRKLGKRIPSCHGGFSMACAIDVAAEAHEKTFGNHCDSKCIKAQLEKYYGDKACKPRAVDQNGKPLVPGEVDVTTTGTID